jgi:uncharacterized protein
MMKYVWLLLLVGGIFWWLRTARQTSSDKRSEPEVLDMVRCKQCGLHLPQIDAVVGKSGFFCCKEHQKLFDFDQ